MAVVLYWGTICLIAKKRGSPQVELKTVGSIYEPPIISPGINAMKHLIVFAMMVGLPRSSG
jgi:hypothetical protein